MTHTLYLRTQFWTTVFTPHLSHGAKLLAIYCLTGHHRFTRHPKTIALATAQADLNWSWDVLKAYLQELSDNDWVTYRPGSPYMEVSSAFQRTFSKMKRNKTTSALPTSPTPHRSVDVDRN